MNATCITTLFSGSYCTWLLLLFLEMRRIARDHWSVIRHLISSSGSLPGSSWWLSLHSLLVLSNYQCYKYNIEEHQSLDHTGCLVFFHFRRNWKDKSNIFVNLNHKKRRTTAILWMCVYHLLSSCSCSIKYKVRIPFLILSWKIHPYSIHILRKITILQKKRLSIFSPLSIWMNHLIFEGVYCFTIYYNILTHFSS